MMEPKKTTRAYQVNQPRPAGLPEYISTEAWEGLQALPTRLCATLFITDDAREGVGISVKAEHDGKPYGSDGLLFSHEDVASRVAVVRHAVDNYMDLTLPGLASLGVPPPTEADARETAAKVRAHEVSLGHAVTEPAPEVKVVPTPKKKRPSA